LPLAEGRDQARLQQEQIITLDRPFDFLRLAEPPRAADSPGSHCGTV
jgi:hypothetical protein